MGSVSIKQSKITAEINFLVGNLTFCEPTNTKAKEAQINNSTFLFHFSLSKANKIDFCVQASGFLSSPHGNHH